MSATYRAFRDWELRNATQMVNRSSVSSLAWPSHSFGPWRTLWLFGNSVARIHFFALVALLNGHTYKGIALQIEQCGRGGAWKGRRPGQGISCLGPCHCSEAIIGGGRIVFVWQQRLHHETDDLIRALDGKAKTGDAIRFLPGDVVIVNTGLDDVATMGKYISGKRRTRSQAPFNQSSESSLAYWRQRWASSLELNAPALAAAMARCRDRFGVATFWRTSTPVCHGESYTTHWGLRAGKYVTAVDVGTGAAMPRTQSGAAEQTRAKHVKRIASEAAHETSNPMETDLHGLQTVNGLLAYGDGRVREHMEIFGVPVIDMELIDAAAGLCFERASLPVCRCRGYHADMTNIHPDPELAHQQIRLLLNVVSDMCRQDPILSARGKNLTRTSLQPLQ